MPRRKRARLQYSYEQRIDDQVIPAAEGLQVSAPTILVSIGLHSYLQEVRQNLRLPTVPPITGAAIIDTGATVTTVDGDVAQNLELKPSGTVTSVGIGGKSTGTTVACSISLDGLDIDIARAHCHDLTNVFARSHCADWPRRLAALGSPL